MDWAVELLIAKTDVFRFLGTMPALKLLGRFLVQSTDQLSCRGLNMED